MVRILMAGFLLAALAACGDNVVKTRAPDSQGGGQAAPLSLEGNPPAIVRADREFYFRPEVGNADLSNLHFFATKPDWLTLDPKTGELRGTPTEDKVAKYLIELAAVDGAGAERTVTLRFELEVGVPLTSLPSKSVPSKAGTVVLEDEIYVIGGEINGTATSDVLVFNSGEQQWTTGPPLLQPRSDFAAISYKGKIYVFGGVDQNGTELATGEVLVFDETGSEWVPLENPSFAARQGLCAAVLGEAIYLIGGNTFAGGVFGNVDVFQPATDRGITGVWTAVAEGLQVPRAEHRCVASGENIIVLGGRGSGELPVEIFSPGNGFSRKETLPPTLRTLWAGLQGDKIYAFGGEGESSTTNSVHEYDPAAGTWSRKESTLRPRAYFAGANVGDAFYFFGGGSDAVEKYRPVFDYPAPPQ